MARIWREWNLQPHRVETFKFSTDPELEAKVRDVVGLYLDPPENAVVLCVDEKSQIQALDRTAADAADAARACPSGAPTTTSATAPPRLFAALEVATGKVTATPATRGTATRSSWPSSSWSPRPTRGVQLHVVLRQLRHPQAPRRSSAGWPRNPRFHMHFTPTSASWLNLVEIFFGIITRQAIRRGTFTSVARPHAAIRSFIDGYNDRCEPFTWTKTADEILSKAKRQMNSDTRH